MKEEKIAENNQEKANNLQRKWENKYKNKIIYQNLLKLILNENKKFKQKFEEQLNAGGMHKNDAMRKNELYVWKLSNNPPGVQQVLL